MPSASAETRVNNLTEGSQLEPTIVKLATGSTVVLWFDQQSGSSKTIVGQIFSPSGARVGSTFMAGSSMTGSSFTAAPSSDGGFLVAMTSTGLENESDVFLWRMDSVGGHIGSTHFALPGVETGPALQHLSGGGFALTYLDWSGGRATLVLQLLDEAGAVRGSPVAVANPQTAPDASSYTAVEASVAQLASGDLAVAYAWKAQTGSGSQTSISVQRLSAEGSPLGPPRSADVRAAMNEHAKDPTIVATTDGGYVVGWVLAKTDGRAEAGLLKVNADGSTGARTTLAANPIELGVDIDALPGGGFVATYAAENRDVLVQVFDAAGAPVGDPTVANAYRSGSQGDPDATWLGGDALGVTWTSWFQDGSGPGVYMTTVSGFSSAPPPPSEGQVLRSDQYGDTMRGGSGADTLYAGQGPDQLTGGAGADVFVYEKLPWNAGVVTDFTVGTDRLDLSALFRGSGYSGANPQGDGYVRFATEGGGTAVYYDTDGTGAGNTIWFKITTLQGVTGASWSQLAGNAAPPPPPAAEVGFAEMVVQKPEGNSGATPFDFTVTRTGNTTGTTAVDWAVMIPTSGAVTAADFTGPLRGSLTFAPGETSKTFTVQVAGDTSAEANEAFDVALHNVSGGIYRSGDDATGVIVNDDTAEPPPASGQVLRSDQYADTLQGGSGADTLYAGQGPDQLTGGAGADAFVYEKLPWNAGVVTDFAVGSDRLDLSSLLSASGYSGSNPQGDGYIRLVTEGGGTTAYYDTDGAASGNTIWFKITTLQGVTGATWQQLAGASAPPPSPPTVSNEIVSVSETNLPNGTAADAAALTRTGAVTITASAAVDDIKVDGVFVVRDGAFTATDIQMLGGALRITGWDAQAGKLSYSYTLAGAVNHPAPSTGDGFTIRDYVFVEATDVRGGANARPLEVWIGDDAPKGPSIGATATSGGPAVTGKVPFTLGGDGGTVEMIAGQGGNAFDRTMDAQGNLVVDGNYGTLTLNSSGHYSYTPRAGVTDGARDTFQYVLRDNDGDNTGGRFSPEITFTIQGGSEPPPPSGQVLTSDQYGDTLVGGAGDDTPNAGQGPDQLTGGGGGDLFVYTNFPWNAGQITDFTVRTDKLDLSALLDSYTGSNPVADRRVEFRDDGQGNTQVHVDRDAPDGGDWPFLVVTLRGVQPNQIASSDWIF